MHVRKKKISKEEMDLMIFQTKYSRIDIKQKIHNPQIGMICSLCGAHILYLDAHLLKMHYISRKDPRYINISQTSKECHRKIHFKSDDDTTVNPLFDYRMLTPRINSECFNEIVSPAGSILPSDSLSIFDPPEVIDEYTIDDCLVSPQIHQRNKLINSISSFKIFLATNWGGSKSQKSISMDVANIREIYNVVGQNEFWNPKALNAFFTKLSTNTLSPITVHAKLRSLRRFIHFLKQSEERLLPSPKKFFVLKSMLKGVEKTLLRSRKNAMKNVMARNRKNYNHTLETLKHWRILRANNSPLHLIDQLTTKESLVTREEFDDIRNYFIAEIIIANGQRSGIVSGMIVSEVQDARNQIT